MKNTADRLMNKWLKWSLLALAALVVAQLALSWLWPILDDNDPPPGVEQQLSIVAVVVVFALPHIIAFLARDRRWLFKVAGAIGIALTLVSPMGHSLVFVAVPLWLIPSIGYLIASRRTSGRPRVPTPLIALISLTLAVVAILSLFTTDDPRCTKSVQQRGELVYMQQRPCDPFHSGRLSNAVISWSGTEDVIALHESLLSLSFSVGILVVCVLAGASHPRVTRTMGS